MLEYVDRSLQKDFREAGDKDNSKVKTQNTHHNQHQWKEIREMEKDQKLKMLNMLLTMEIETQVQKAVHRLITIWQTT